MDRTAPTGLYGWIRSNDGRSLGLFFGFLLAVQLLAAPTLFLPLVFLDLAHAPVLAWSGYLLRYVPIVLVGSILWFGWKYWWHIETVKKAVGFRFIDSREEPYLCQVIEPLITMWGLPVPFVGVIESPARNAFACGIGRKKAVIVVTRGLIEDLEREELECVLAHELSHIKNGDIRLMAAANIFMTALTDMQRNNPLQMTPVHVLMAIAVPAMLPLTLIGNFAGWIALRAGQMSRLVIASKREFIADAEAVQLTKNPGAMASALVKVEHAYVVEGARNEDDAMMIAGDTEGENATHPTVAQRIAALARTTGSMVFISPHSPSAKQFAENPSLSEAQAAALLRQLPAERLAERVNAKSKTNWFGLDTKGLVMAVVTVGLLIGLHWEDMDRPTVMMAKFDVRPIATVMGSVVSCGTIAAQTEACDYDRARAALAGVKDQNNTLAGWLAKTEAMRRADGVDNPDMTVANISSGYIATREWKGESGRLTGVTAKFDGPGEHSFAPERGKPTGGFPEHLQVAELEQVGCYHASMNYHEPKGRYRMGIDDPGSGEITGLERMIISSVIPTGKPGSEENDLWLKEYLSTRQLAGQMAYSNYGLPGTERIRKAFRDPMHQGVLDRLAERMADPRFSGSMNTLGRAKAKALIARPDDFIPCAAVKHMPA